MQALQRGLAELAGPGGAEAAADALRIVDTYIKVGMPSFIGCRLVCLGTLSLIGCRLVHNLYYCA